MTTKTNLRAFAQAKSRYDESIDLFSALLTNDRHDVVLDLRRRRAKALLRLGDISHALSEAQSVLQHFQGRREVADCHQLLVDIEAHRGALDEAVSHSWESQRLGNDFLLTYVTGLTPSEQQDFFRMWIDPGLHASVRLAVHSRADDDVREATAEWLLNGKAKSAEVLARMSQQATGENRTRFLAAVERLAYLHYGGSNPNVDAFISAEADRREASEIQTTAFHPRWHKLQRLRKTLADDEVFIDIFSLKDRQERHQYYAWVIMESGPVRVVPLGGGVDDAKRIDTLVSEFLRRMGDYRSGHPERDLYESEGGDSGAEHYLRRNFLEPLSQLVLEPLVAETGEKNRWIISPDGSLWSLP